MTQGPWEVAEAGGYENGRFHLDEYFVRRPEDDVAIAADILDPDTCKPSKENAQLIAAAPDLLEACKEALFWLDRYPDDTFAGNIARQLRTAIGKAVPR